MGNKLSPKMSDLVERLLDRNAKLLEALDRNNPQLSKQEIDLIAERVAQILAEQMSIKNKPNKKERIKKLAYDLSVNLAASGIWALLMYIGAVLLFLEGSEKSSEAREQERRFDAIKQRMSKNLSEEDKASLHRISTNLVGLSSYKFIGAELQAEFKDILKDAGAGEDADAFWSLALINTLLWELREDFYAKVLSSGN